MKEDFEFFYQNRTPFSNWYMKSFTHDGFTYNCSEQYMMAQKAILFGDLTALQKIMDAVKPSEQKALGRTVRNFDNDIWMTNCIQIMVRGLVSKFEQDQFSKDALLATGDRCLVEASPHDTIWGIGLTADDPRAWDKETWLGKNLLGYTLNIVREIIRGKQDVTSNP